MKKLLVTLFALFASILSYSQCKFDVYSTDGYTAHIELEAVSINAPSLCPDPTYNYTVNIDYKISFSGGIGNLYTLQAYIGCDNDVIYFDLPKTEGTGTVTTSTSTRNLIQGDCNTATPASLLCNEIELVISGSGITHRTIICGTPLPIELLYFNADIDTENNSVLSWATTMEKNNDFFSIERSLDGVNFDVIGTIKGGGNSLVLLEYDYTDYNISNSYYYRVKQTDFDGKYDYTPIRYVDYNNKKTRIEYKDGQIVFNNLNGLNYTVYSISGIIYDTNISVEPNYKIDIIDYKSGNYIIKTIDSITGRQEFFKFFKD